jgi:hypothetical protein
MRLRTLIAAVCLPFTLTAQSPSATGASPANGVARTFLSFGQPYGGWLLLAFDSIPASKYLFHPTPVQQSIGSSLSISRCGQGWMFPDSSPTAAIGSTAVVERAGR